MEMGQTRTGSTTDAYADTSSRSQGSSTIAAIAEAIKNLDRIISRFGDSSFVPYCKDANEYGNGNNDCKDSNENNADGDFKSNSNNYGSIFTNDSAIMKTYAPKGLEESFQQLYEVLCPCLVPTTTTVNNTNNSSDDPSRDTSGNGRSCVRSSSLQESKTTMTASVILMGPPCGKTLLIERCLAACEAVSSSLLSPNKKTRKNPSSSSSSSPAGTGPALALYRKVSINGIVIRGEDVPSVIFEIIRQLSDIAFHEKKLQQQQNQKKSPHPKDASGDTSSKPLTKKRKKRDVDHQRNYRDDTSKFSSHRNNNSNGDATKDKQERLLQVSATEEENYLLRLRKSSFSSNLSLLESTFRIAEVDKIPIVLILDELDSFTDEGERQLLLYHLLDRVATPGSNLCLLATTSNFATLSLLEKRIRSRAEGTSKIIYVKPPDTYNSLINILQSKLELLTPGINIDDDNKNSAIWTMKDDIMHCLLLQPQHPAVEDSLVHEVGSKESSADTHARHKTMEYQHSIHGTKRQQCMAKATNKIRNCLQRAFRLGKDVRWFSRVISCALTMYRFELVLFLDEQHESKNNKDDRNEQSTTSDYSEIPRFDPHYLMQSLITMGATLDDDNKDENVEDFHRNRKEYGVCSDMHSHNVVDDNASNNDNKKVRRRAKGINYSDGDSVAIASDTRVQALFDLSTPQLSIIFSARRILARDKHREELSIPLTIQRIFQEYESYRASGSGSTGGRYSTSHLWPAIWQLLERGLLAPTMDHSGGGALQYNFAATYRSMDSYTLSRLPMHITLDIDHEIGIALKKGKTKGIVNGNNTSRKSQQLDCPTDLIEWGRRTN